MLTKDHLEVMPAYWWLYNMYALARNSWKFQNRDKRVSKIQHIEFDPFAPDTMAGSDLSGTCSCWKYGPPKPHCGKTENHLPGDRSGADHIWVVSCCTGDEKLVNSLEVLGEHMEHTKRKTLILKPFQAYHAYRDMLQYYAVMNLIAFMRQHPDADLTKMRDDLQGEREQEWVNLGGQIMQKNDLDKLRSDIGSGKLEAGKKSTAGMTLSGKNIRTDKQKHAWATFCEIAGTKQLTKSHWEECLDRTLKIQQYISDQVYVSRKKDYDNPFRRATFRNNDEMKATIGTS